MLAIAVGLQVSVISAVGISRAMVMRAAGMTLIHVAICTLPGMLGQCQAFHRAACKKRKTYR